MTRCVHVALCWWYWKHHWAQAAAEDVRAAFASGYVTVPGYDALAKAHIALGDNAAAIDDYTVRSASGCSVSYCDLCCFHLPLLVLLLLSPLVVDDV